MVAKKSEHPLAWLAWVPFVSLWLMSNMSDTSRLWVILSFILFPFFPYCLILLWWRISENANKPGLLGILMIVPVLDIAIECYMAFEE